ncbi:MAG: hypothetical protein VX278_09300 [Myxococcota bacterium]|nr:hypothetical protein [Myxococcota bacterium]
MTRYLGLSLLTGILAVSTGCAPKQKAINTEKLTKKQKKGYPNWLTNPYQKELGLSPREAICASGQSTLGLQMGNTDAARTDSEMQVKNRIAEQLEAEVGLLQERVNNVMRDMSSGRDVGDLSLKNINKNFQKTRLVGLRYLATYMHPDPINPDKVFVLGCVTVDFANMAKEITNQMLNAAAMQEALENKHQENMLRFEAVERDYLRQREDSLRSKGLLIDQQ